MNDHLALRSAVSQLLNSGGLAGLAAQLKVGATRAGEDLRQAIVTEVAAFSTSGNPDIMLRLESHGREHIEEIIRLLSGGAADSMEFVSRQAQRQAEQRFPLEAILHAYRCGHRVLSRWVRDAVIELQPVNVEQAVTAVADFAIEYTNAISTVMAADYVNHARLMAEADSDRRSELLNILLSGYDESDAKVTRLLKRAGYLEQRHSYCVVLTQAVLPSEMENPERVQRIISALMTVVTGSSIRVLIGQRNNIVTAIMSDVRRQSGWTSPATSLCERLQTLLLNLGPAVIVGVSNDHPSTGFLPRALQEASMALDFASVTRRVVAFGELPIRSLVLHRGGDYIRSAAPSWVAALIAADDKAQGALIGTLRTLADCDLNVQEAGRRLGLHANTVYARLGRIKQLTGLDGQRHHDLVELLLAADGMKA